jgi:hypothetical protein
MKERSSGEISYWTAPDTRVLRGWKAGNWDTQNDENTKLINCLDAYRGGANWEAEVHSLREGSNIIQLGLGGISKSKIG